MSHVRLFMIIAHVPIIAIIFCYSYYSIFAILLYILQGNYNNFYIINRTSLTREIFGSTLEINFIFPHIHVLFSLSLSIYIYMHNCIYCSPKMVLSGILIWELAWLFLNRACLNVEASLSQHVNKWGSSLRQRGKAMNFTFKSFLAVQHLT